MSAEEIRRRFLEFFRARGHAVVPSSSLIPDDPSVLLTTAGMQQFKKYYTGELDPLNDFKDSKGNPTKSTASVQKCFRTSDIDEVGDETHLTFFEMLGNFSFGGYFKEKAIEYGFEFITKEMKLDIDYVTVFDPAKVPDGDWRKGVPFDEESYALWQKYLPKEKIRREGIDNFWGPTGNEGPCGPTTEIYVRGVEIWNIVFNQFYRDSTNKLTPLKIQGVDTGMGLERLAMVSQNVPTIFETDLFSPLTSYLSDAIPEGIQRVLLDHSRSAMFLLSDGVRPSNKEAGYILRRLLRRIFTYEHLLKFPTDTIEKLMRLVVTNYGKFYSELTQNQEDSINAMRAEKEKFLVLLSKGAARVHELIEKKKKAPESRFAHRDRPDFGSKSEDYINNISGYEAFDLYQTYGFPPEVIEALLAYEGYTYHKEEFKKAFEEAQRKHQEVSRAGQEKKFGGHGLILNTGELKAGNEEELKKVLRLHTATHLLQAALREVLGSEVRQRGSDITAERTRFDFSFSRKLTPEEIKKVETLVNEKIKEDLPVSFKEMSKADAEKTGALYFFKEKYPERVKVYYVGRSLETAWSKEFCGGPHVAHTGEIGTVKIIKEEAVGAGMRRIRAMIPGS